MNILEALMLLSMWSRNHHEVPTTDPDDDSPVDTPEVDIIYRPTPKQLNVYWLTFINAHNRTYADPAEKKRRMEIFFENTKWSAEHNRRYDTGDETYYMGPTPYADMTHDEYLQYTGLQTNMKTYQIHIVEGENDPTYAHYLPAANVVLPDQIDWRKLKAVTEIKNQGQCGSCYAFAATGVLEAVLARRTGHLVALSEQNLIDCSCSHGNHGCTSGWPSDAFRYIRDNQGIDTAESYPYEERAGKCRFSNATIGTTDVAIVKVALGDEEQMRNAVATVGPVAIAFDASERSFMMYKGGIYYEPKCNPKVLNHAVVVVGYGVDENGVKYWLLKNSWGPEWGESGYMRLARDRNNHCGVASAACYAIG